LLTAKKISGSNDPLGVRRATLGILKTIIQKDLNLNLSILIKQAIDLLPVQIEDKTKLYNSVREFFEQRLIVFLSDKYKHDVLEACISEKDVLADLKDVIERLNIVTDIIQKPNYSQFHEAINRIIRLIKNETEFKTVDSSLFNSDAEISLWSVVKNIDENKLSYKELENELVKLIPFISEFFEEVLVMDNDEKIKQNRLALLNVTKQKYAKIADFSKIVF
jgi:glycyl-tRNA synthetase beta chain